jgi:hypothetical protein
VCCGHASITRRCAFTPAERDEARLADGNAAEPVEVLRVCLSLIRSANRRCDRGNDSVAAREQPASDREQRTADEDPADGGGRDAEQHRTAVRIIEAVDVRTAPARVGDFHQWNGDAGQRDRYCNEECAVPPTGRRRRARTAIGGRFAAKPEPAACEREGRDDRDRADHAARVVAGDVVERGVRHQIVGHDIDDVVRQYRGRGSRRNQQRRQRWGKRAHAALFGPPRRRASSRRAAWQSTARPSGRARRRARVYE